MGTIQTECKTPIMNCKKSSKNTPSYSRQSVAGDPYVYTTHRGVKKGVHNIAHEIISLYGHTPLGKNRQFLHNRWADSLETETVRKAFETHAFWALDIA